MLRRALGKLKPEHLVPMLQYVYDKSKDGSLGVIITGVTSKTLISEIFNREALPSFDEFLGESFKEPTDIS